MQRARKRRSADSHRQLPLAGTPEGQRLPEPQTHGEQPLAAAFPHAGQRIQQPRGGKRFAGGNKEAALADGDISADGFRLAEALQTKQQRLSGLFVARVKRDGDPLRQQRRLRPQPAALGRQSFGMQ
ncbi:hypothetical protein KOXM_08502 [Klebsiella michiganensis]|nr:hypothetical protein KOXM_08502 [Klebsiella michiganensis]